MAQQTEIPRVVLSLDIALSKDFNDIFKIKSLFFSIFLLFFVLALLSGKRRKEGRNEERREGGREGGKKEERKNSRMVLHSSWFQKKNQWDETDCSNLGNWTHSSAQPSGQGDGVFRLPTLVTKEGKPCN